MNCSSTPRSALTLVVMTTVLVACGAPAQRNSPSSLRGSLRESGVAPYDEERPRADARDAVSAADAGEDVDAYVAFALQHHPELQAAFARWEAAVYRVASARRLPDPQISYAFYVRSVETRVGPQRQRVSIRQNLPLPAGLRASGDAAGARARAMEARFDALALRVRSRVATEYWGLWAVREARAVRQSQLLLLDAMLDLARARVETGAAGLSELQQIAMTRARVADSLAALDEQERRRIAGLAHAVGTPPGEPLPTEAAAPTPARPSRSEAELMALVEAHPDLEAIAAEVEARNAEAEAARARGLPSFGLGLDWIETGRASSGVQGSGQDALIVVVGASIPLQRGIYRDEARAAESEAVGLRASRRAALDMAQMELAQALSLVRDQARRARLYRDVLVPQAEATYQAVLGAYRAGRASVAEILIAQRDLLELREALVVALAEHWGAWGRLEAVVGVELTPVPLENDSSVADAAREPRETDATISEDTEVRDAP